MQLKVDTLPDPGDRFQLGDEIAAGSWAKVIKAIDKQSDGKIVAIKIQSYDGDQKDIIDDEYRVLRDFCDHPNLLKLYGVYRKKVSGESDQIWFVLEYCEGGSVVDFVNRLHSVNRRLSEEHIAYILKEAATGLAHLHKNHHVHRDVRGANILLTVEGEVKLCDYGLTKSTGTTLGRRSSCIGSPCWMAPEMFASSVAMKNEGLYSNKIDVWSLGITAIEIGDGVAPFLDMHPTRAMFQIVRNPPPTLYRPANWSQNYNDFIAECLEKNQDNRPFMMELLEHPFFQELIGQSGSTHHLSCEVKQMLDEISVVDRIPREEISILKGCIKKLDAPLEKMFDEDLCAVDRLSEEKISEHLKYRLANGDSYTFVGDVLLSINSNEMPTEFSRSFHFKYACKSRSDNAPHIFTVADSAYQDMLHHEEPQHILFSGESYSGKTTQMKRAVDHLCILGEGNSNCKDRVKKAINIVHQLVNAGTPVNPDSSRCCLQTQLTFGSTGKLSGVIFDVFLLEKLRVSSTDMNQSNFHIFYYFYDAMSENGALDLFKLEAGRKYRYFRTDEGNCESNLPYCRYDIQRNISKFQEFEDNLKLLDFDDEQINSVRRVLAAILILGNVRFSDDGKFATIETRDEVLTVAQLLEVDEKKFEWSLVNYCLIRNGSAEKRKHTIDEARDARDVLAATIYCRLVDWIVNIINQKFALGRAVFGDMHIISLTDMFGFECLHRNGYEQLMINSLNEQMQYHYNQRMFAWEMLELEEEQIPHQVYKYHDNKPAVDDLMIKPNGLFYLLDDATRDRHTHEFVIDTIANKKATHIQRASSHEFSVAHYTGKVTYDVRDMADKNRDFVPPEMVETMRLSKNETVKVMFTNPLSKTGNLTVAYDQPTPIKNIGNKKSKWGAALMAEKQSARKLNTLSHGQYSQVHKMRTLCGVFRATSLEILKGLSIGGNSGNTHFVRCIRSTLDHKPRAFQSDMVHQQLRALAVLDTAIARQKGFPQRICFQEFLRRYKFLAFEFDENVELTKDNCRLLLIRLKMEGWAIGKTKVFLKYYNVEYLSRLYETQVKKIIKVQCMMRAFLAKRNVAIKLNKFRQESVQKDDPPRSAHEHDSPADDSAAVTIQKAYRGYKIRERFGPLLNSKSGNIDAAVANFIRPYAKRWKAKSIYQVLLLYRAARYQDFVNLTQQIHLYDQAIVCKLKATNGHIVLDRVDERERNPALLGARRQAVRKLPFRLDEIPFYDTSYMCDPINGKTNSIPDIDSDQEDWDTPLRRTTNISSHITKSYALPCDYDYDPLANTQNYQRVIPSHNNYSVETIPMPPPSPSPSRPTVYKRRPSSPLPNTYVAPIIRNETSERRPVVNNDSNKAIGKLNPVREMELLARNRSADNEDEDKPPFNFQGMLRKTNHHRASMKRSRSENNNSANNENIIYHSQEISGSKSSTKVNFGFDMNDNVPPPVAPRNKVAPPVPIERKSSIETIHFGTYVQEEIHPGVILEGYAVEL